MKVFAGSYRDEDVILDSHKDRVAIALIKHQHEQLVILRKRCGVHHTTPLEAELYDVKVDRDGGDTEAMAVKRIFDGLSESMRRRGSWYLRMVTNLYDNER